MEICSARLIGRKLPFYREKHLEMGNVGIRPVYRPMDGGQLILGMRGAVDLVTQKNGYNGELCNLFFFIYYKIGILLLSMYSCILSNIFIYLL